jgi:Outer membrane protein beta-barrel domain
LSFIRSTAPFLVALCFTGTLAHAQSGLDVLFGVGTARVESSEQSIDTFGTGNFVNTPAMAGAFGKIGADILFTPHLGVGAQTDFRFAQAPYAGLNYRPTFYDFNAIYLPVLRSKRVLPELQGGLGAANLRFYYSSANCNAFTGCSSSSSYLDSSNHFQVHLAAGVRFYVTPHLFVRPQVDARYVNDFFQFGSNWVPEYSASVGWSFGER